MTKLVSIIMNCKNGERYLKYSLNSVLKQKYKNWELIFVDNNSKDETKKIFKKYKDNRFKYFNTKENLKLGAARQFALKKCRGDFIAFLDSDDLWSDSKLQLQIPKFRDKKVGIVISNTVFFNNHKEIVYYKYPPETGFVFKKLIQKYNINLETLVCRKSIIKKLNFKFNKNFEMISDYELCIKLSLVSKVSYVDKILSKWRVHPKSDSWNKRKKFFTEKLNFLNKLQINNKLKKKIEFKRLLEIEKKRLKLLIIQENLHSGLSQSKQLYKIFNNFYLCKEFFIALLVFFLPFTYSIISFIKKFFLKP